MPNIDKFERQPLNLTVMHELPYGHEQGFVVARVGSADIVLGTESVIFQAVSNHRGYYVPNVYPTLPDPLEYLARARTSR